MERRVDISFILHLVGILAPGLWLGRALRIAPPLHIGLTFLIFETSLVVGAGILTWAGMLGHLHAYQLVTTLCSVAIAAGLWWLARSDPQPAGEILSDDHRNSIGRAWSAIPIACLAVFAVCMLVLALSAYPAVEDSLTVKLPKVVFSIESNSYLPSDLADDPRMYMSPVYPALVQLFLILNGQTTHALLVLGFVHWIVSGAAVYQICRNVGASRFAAWTATALALLTPMLIVQGSSEGDDIIAATPFLLALMFFTSWLNDRRQLDAALAGAGLGLSVVMKFLPLFYVPAIPLIIGLAFFTYKGPQILAWIRASIAAGAIFCAAFVCVTLPHLVANWAAFGNPFYVSKGVAATSNSPFDLGCGLRGIVGYTAQFALADFATLATRLFKRVFMYFDRTSLRDENARLAGKSLNDLLSGMVPFHPNAGCTAYGNVYSLGSDFISDNTVWFGVFGPMLLVSVIVALLSRKDGVGAADLERLKMVIVDAGEQLIASFNEVSVLSKQPTRSADEQRRLDRAVATAVTALQFQDMANQLTGHAQRRLSSVHETLSKLSEGVDPLLAHSRLQPVRQAGMGAGSIDLF